MNKVCRERDMSGPYWGIHIQCHCTFSGEYLIKYGNSKAPFGIPNNRKIC